MAEVRVQTCDPEVEAARLLIERVLGLIVAVPDAIEVRAAAAEGVTVFEVRIAPEDVSRLVGNDGRTLQALRMVLGAVGLRHMRRFILEIEEHLE